jgi:hypothetical protein
MKTKFAMLLALATLVVGGNARAGVVGLSTTSDSTGSFGAGNTVVAIGFNTTGLSGNKFTGISFVGLGTYTGTLTAILTKLGGSPTTTTSILTYSTAGVIINFGTNSGEIGSTNWDASSQYNLTITTDGAITGASVNNSGGITNSIPDWIYSPVGGDYGDVAVTLYAAVPEPGTMILTGTALAAGAVGAYIKRRRKAKAEVAA